MNPQLALVVIIIGAVCYYLLCVRRKQVDRLMSFYSALDNTALQSPDETLLTVEDDLLKNDRLSRAGFATAKEKKSAKLLLGAAVAATAAAGFIFGLRTSPGRAFLFGAIGSYLGTLAVVCYLSYLARDRDRKLLFDLPLCLEAIILLVESGLGILPALQQIVTRSADSQSPAKRALRLVYELASHGLPLSSALELVADRCNNRVLRHTLLHLDISGTEGGALVPSLRSLSDFAHTEWRLSVERRVKRLENLVVFPVFGGVIGLMCLAAAVPLASVLDLKDTLKSGANLAEAKIDSPAGSRATAGAKR